MSNILPPPPDRPGLGSTFKRPINEILIGIPGNGVEIGNATPPELVAFYAANYGASVSASFIRFEVSPPGIGSAFIYYYFVALQGAGPLGGLAQGWVDNTLTVHETSIDFWTGATPTRTDLAYGVHSPVLIQFGPNAAVEIDGGCVTSIQNGGILQVMVGGIIDVLSGADIKIENGGNVDALNGGSITVHAGGQIAAAGNIEIQNGGNVDVLNGGSINVQTGGQIAAAVSSVFTIDGLSAPRGLLHASQVVANPIATSVAGVEITCGSFPAAPITYKDTRAYRWTLNYEASVTVANNRQQIRIRRGVGIAGTMLVLAEIAFPIAAVQQSVVLTGILIAPAGGINQQVTVSVQGGAAFNTAVVGGATQPFQFQVEDIGAAANYSGFSTW